MPHRSSSPSGRTALDAVPEDEARRLLTSCLAAPSWVEGMLRGRPYDGREAALERARVLAAGLSPLDVELALAAHPAIGERPGAGHDAEFSRVEQLQVEAAAQQQTDALAAGNRAYRARFGRVFLIRAAGRSPGEILAELHRRLDNDDDQEHREVVDQLGQIALLRLGQVLGGADRPVVGSGLSTVSTHVLDTARGRPGVGVPVRLDRVSDPGGHVGAGSTDSDGRGAGLAGDGGPAGTYRLTFDTGAYFAGLGVEAFYPRVDVAFTVSGAAEHYHVPVLLSPYSFSTYRGS
jgi:hydroxyisourate hydrolase